MTCYISGNLAICRPNLIGTKRLIRTCLDCGHRGRFGAWMFEWYGGRTICGNCGRRWDDGEWMPFDWPVSDRKRNIESVRKLWNP